MSAERKCAPAAIVPLKQIESGFGYIIIRSPYTPYSTYLRGTIGRVGLGFFRGLNNYECHIEIPIPYSSHLGG